MNDFVYSVGNINLYKVGGYKVEEISLYGTKMLTKELSFCEKKNQMKRKNYNKKSLSGKSFLQLNIINGLNIGCFEVMI